MTRAVELAQVASTGVSEAFKNRIINGAMVIDQRNAGASVTPTTTSFITDRWAAGGTQSSKFSVQQNQGSVTPPAGFTNYLGVTSLSAYSVLSADAFFINQKVEGFNSADLGWGTANAKTVTLSFWVRSSLTGAFGGSLYNAAASRSYPYSYTISASNTWEYKTVTIPGDTTGTWETTNGTGITVLFGLGYGSSYLGPANAWAGTFYGAPTGTTSIVGTNGATWQVTGVQLEVGSSATSFEYRPYGTELNLCLRYFFNLPTSGGGSTWLMAFYNSLARFPIPIPVPMRTTPSVTFTGTATGAIFTTVDDANYVNMTYTGASTGAPSLSNTFVALYGSVSVSTAGASVAYIQNGRTFSISAEL
jgi:hypothetical protein